MARCISARFLPLLPLTLLCGCTLWTSHTATPPASGRSVTCLTPATQYFVDPSGADSNDGLSPASPWRTITRVNAAALAPCSTVSFKAGGIWRGQLLPHSGSTAAGPITYGAYGAGAAPVLLGSVSESSAASWVNVAPYGLTLWRTIAPVLNPSAAPVDVGNLVFINAVGNRTAGFKKFLTVPLQPVALAAVLSQQGDFWSDPGSGYLWMRSATNPGAYYLNIEAALDRDIISLNSIHDVVIQDLSLLYGGRNGINAVNSGNLTLQYLHIAWVGGAAWGGHPGRRLGNGIQLWQNASNVLVQGNRIGEVYDTALTNQADHSVESIQSNIIYVNNLLYNTPFAAVEIWNRGPSRSLISNLRYIHNTSVNPGVGWSAAQRPDCRGDHVVLATVTNPPIGVVIENNIFYGGAVGLWVSQASTGHWSRTALQIDYNDYFQTGDSTQNYSSPSQWTQRGAHLWSVIMTADLSRLTLDGIACSSKPSLAVLAHPDDCFFDTATGDLYLYAVSNPGLVHSAILATVRNSIALIADTGVAYSAEQLVAYQRYAGMDAHSITADPRFAFAYAPDDLPLPADSPASRIGARLGVPMDIRRHPRPASGSQDLGAFGF